LPSHANNRGWNPSFVSAVGACLVASIAGFLVIDAITPVSPWPDLPEMGMSPSDAVIKLYHDAEYAHHSHNGAINVGILGATIGLLLGLVTVSRRRILSGIAGAIGGFVGGAASGYVIGQYVARGRIFQGEQLMWISTMYHFALWGSIGVGIALALSAVHPNIRQTSSAVISALVGGLLAAIVFNLACTTFYPMSNLLLITPQTAVERMIWIGSGALLLGLGFGLGMRPSTVKPAPANAPAE
jgi:hypothetical protein